MAAIKQHRRPSVRGSKLKPTRGGHVRHLHLRDHTGEGAIAQAILGHGKHFHVLAALRVENLVRTEPDLFEAGRIKIEDGDGPQHGEAGLIGKSRCDPRHEQPGGGIVVEAGRTRRDFMQSAAVETAIGEPPVDLR